jgi:uncharacterized membrane protein YdjX (TVP38/TMEM64 family)
MTEVQVDSDAKTTATETPGETAEDMELEAVAPGLSRELKRMLTLLAAGVAAFALLYFTPIGSIARDVHSLRAFLAGDDLWAEVTYVGLVTVFVALGLPRLIFYGLGGLAFGFWQGLLLAQAGSLLGSYITFCAVRRGGRGWLEERFGSHRLVGKAFNIQSSVKAVVLIRQLPLSSVMINSGLALSKVTVRIFLIGSFIGFLPQGVVATLIGSGIVDEKVLEGFGKLLAAGIVLLIGAVWLWRRTAGRRKSDAA